MEVFLENKLCDQSGCKAFEGGNCLEGIDITKDECPHFYISESLELVQNKSLDTKNNKKEVVTLFTGKEMTFSETALITNNNDCKLIVIVGESDSGKTTLLSEYYISFQKGPFFDYYFAGSMTQRGFEDRCFQSTIISKNNEPNTERTKSREFSFLHLAVKQSCQLHENAQHLLFSDISGEIFRDAKASSTLMNELKIIRSADFVLLLLDGRKIADINTRAFTIENGKTFIQKAIDENIFNKNTKLKVIVTKWDFLHEDYSFDLEKKIIEPYQSRFINRLNSLEFAKIAARSTDSKIEAGMGLLDLFKQWTDNDNPYFQAEDNTILINSERAYLNYKSPKF